MLFINSIKTPEKMFFRYLLFVLVFLEILFFSFYGISRHYNYLTSINDLGCFDQAIWGLLNGEPFLNTILFSKPLNWLGFHFQPVLTFFTPFYFVFPSVIWLILAQAVALPLAALPIYSLSQLITGSSKGAFLWAVIYLANPFVLSAASWDFHPVSLAVPFVALACLALYQGRFGLLLMSNLFILLCKEHLGLMSIGFGLLWLIRRHKVWPGIILILLGLGHLLLVLQFVMPSFSPTGTHSMLVEGTGQLSRYAWLGKSLPEVIRSITTHPLEVAHVVFDVLAGWRYLLILLLPLLGFPLLALGWLLPSAGDVIANLFSANPMPRSAFGYHSVTTVPVMVAAALCGSLRMKNVLRSIMPEKQFMMVLAATLTMSWVAFPFFSLPGGIPLWEPKQVLNLNDDLYPAVSSVINNQMSLSVQSNVGAHFSQRRKIYKYPDKVGEVDAVILRLENPSKVLRVDEPDQIGTLGHHLQMPPKTYLESIRDLLSNPRYQGVFWIDPWLIVTKEPSSNFSINEITKKVNLLGENWGLQAINPAK